MNKLYATLFFIGLGIFAHLSAQTLKNIHRHDSPVIRMPVELIDKVEIVQPDTVKLLQVVPLFGDVVQVPVNQIDSITHYIGSVKPELLGEMRISSVMGIVRDSENTPLMNAIVRSPFGGEETLTDINGVFYLNNIVVYDKLGFVSVEKNGYHKGSRSFLPLSNGLNSIQVELLPLVQSGFILSSSAGGQITSGPLQLNFPPNAFFANGQLFNGTVRVYATSLDPTNTDMQMQMPGDLIGGWNDSLRLLRSFGMASVELKDISLTPLQLAPGVEVTVTYTIPPTLLAGAPETIDWWSFDDLLGYWKHEGVAQKQGNQYIGAATHFSWWNLDIPESFNEFHGTVNNASGNPISNAKINLTSPTLGTITAYTNQQGAFSGRVPKNQNLSLNIYLTCSTTNDWTLAGTHTVQSLNDPIDGSYTASLSGFYALSGTVVNCQGQPISQGYVSIGSQVYITNQGAFTIQTCATGSYEVQGFDLTTPDSIKVSDVVTAQVGTSGVNIGNIQACSQFESTVVDFDGNTYATVLIGSQLWMAENLKTTKFNNGIDIPNITDNAAWSPLTTPAWSNYQNLVENDALYGKIYNGWAAINSNNLCPVGWHVPSINEWVVLRDYLGGTTIAGGKMKSVDGWVFPAVGGTNSSGFNGTPAGIRNMGGQGTFDDLGDNAYWWTSTAQTGTNSAAHVYLSPYEDSMNLLILTRKAGMSVRCIKD